MLQAKSKLNVMTGVSAIIDDILPSTDNGLHETDVEDYILMNDNPNSIYSVCQSSIKTLLSVSYNPSTESNHLLPFLVISFHHFLICLATHQKHANNNAEWLSHSKLK